MIYLGYLGKQFTYYTKDGETCKSSFILQRRCSQRMEAALVNLKSRGRLIHPNFKCFIPKNIKQKF